jgi:hypothetical protein
MRSRRRQTPPPPPSVEELLCAAAHNILTDGLPHEPQAKRWALGFLVTAAGGKPTAFTRRQAKRLSRH